MQPTLHATLTSRQWHDLSQFFTHTVAVSLCQDEYGLFAYDHDDPEHRIRFHNNKWDNEAWLIRHGYFSKEPTDG